MGRTVFMRVPLPAAKMTAAGRSTRRASGVPRVPGVLLGILDSAARSLRRTQRCASTGPSAHVALPGIRRSAAPGGVAPRLGGSRTAFCRRWLGGQDSNLDTQIQSLMAYR